MSALHDRPSAGPAQMDIELFETLAAIADREGEGVRMEFINGDVGGKDVPDSVHEAIVMWLVRQCIQYRPELDLHTNQGLKIETYRQGRARPDGTLAPVGHFVARNDEGEWVSPDGTLMTVEVTSPDRDTNQRDRIDKPRAYAETGIPVFLLIDRGTEEVTVFSAPHEGSYQRRHTVAFGETVALPDPVGFELDTAPVKARVDQARASRPRQ